MPAATSASFARAKLRPIFMITAASASARRRVSSASGSVAGKTTSASSPQAIGAPATPQAPQMLDTPGTMVTAKRSRKRMKRCMNEP